MKKSFCPPWSTFDKTYKKYSRTIKARHCDVPMHIRTQSIPYLPVYKSTLYALFFFTKICPRLVHRIYFHIIFFTSILFFLNCRVQQIAYAAYIRTFKASCRMWKFFIEDDVVHLYLDI